MLGQLAELPQGGRADPEQPAHLPRPVHPLTSVGFSGGARKEQARHEIAVKESIGKPPD
jgi:hypothetical protein